MAGVNAVYRIPDPHDLPIDTGQTGYTRRSRSLGSLSNAKRPSIAATL